MKKRFLLIVTVLVFAAVAAWNVNLSSKSSGMSDVALENVEALAQESGNTQGTLYGNLEGTFYCCCPGTNVCGSSNCSKCPK